MTLFQAETDQARVRREKTRVAIDLALSSRWEEAAEVNRELIRRSPNDVEAYNRLGKALMELGHYAQAQEAFHQALRLSPNNTIAGKNLARLSRLGEIGTALPKQPHKVLPDLFIEESGKTACTSIQRVTDTAVLAHICAGNIIHVRLIDNHVALVDSQGATLGHLDPPLSVRLRKLIQGGNRYEAVVTSVNDHSLKVLLREVFRHPSQANIPSFPAKLMDKQTGALSEETVEDLVEHALDEKEYPEVDAPVPWSDEEESEGGENVAFAEANGKEAAEEEGEVEEEEKELSAKERHRPNDRSSRHHG